MQRDSPTDSVIRSTWRYVVAAMAGAARRRAFRRSYMIAAICVLAATTLVWAILGARVQIHNADQLSDPYLFTSWAAFHHAYFPGSHTFLLKWPIFWLVALVGVSPASLMVATVSVVLLTVAVLAYVLYCIDRRPLVFGTMCLGLALALLLVPAQPYTGGILPVNMAMLTTRNLEYAVYLLALLLFVRANRLRSRSFAIGVGLLTLLIASDKLFLSLSVGGSVVALLLYALLSNWGITAFMVRWLAGSIIATVGATALLLVISATHLTHLVNGAATTPYGLTATPQDLALGIIYGLTGLVTNAGANPGFNNLLIHRLPQDIGRGLLGYGGIAYLAAAAVLAYALLAVWRALQPTLKSASRRVRPSVPHLLALALIWSSIAAGAVFVATKHYYAVDARYLTICFFALAVAACMLLSRQQWPQPERLLYVGGGLTAAIVFAIFTAGRVSHQQTAAFHTLRERNGLIATALSQHKVDVLVGDYWRVLPVKLASHGALRVMPLGSCTEPTGILTSGDWRPDLTNHSFAYLVSFDSSLTGYPACSIADVTAKYGRPNATQLIAGTPTKPAEALLFYDQGSRSLQEPTRQSTDASILPINLEDLAGTGCDQPTIMNVVAHEDDDLLFLSPDLLHNLHDGHCVRTVFLTAGDAGRGKFYWLSRQLGAEAAYNNMLGLHTVWDQQTVRLADREYITVATPRGNPKVSLVFFNLPDGDLKGQGFLSYQFQSLAKLHAGQVTHLKTVDDQSSYSSDQLVRALITLMNLYQPTAIHTQAAVPSVQFPDHSDHVTAGLYAQLAAERYNQTHFEGGLAIPVVRYVGYPIHGYDGNVTGEDLKQKETAFQAYGQYDGGVCNPLISCMHGTVYGFYLDRQYQDTMVP